MANRIVSKEEIRAQLMRLIHRVGDSPSNITDFAIEDQHIEHVPTGHRSAYSTADLLDSVEEFGYKVLWPLLKVVSRAEELTRYNDTTNPAPGYASEAGVTTAPPALKNDTEKDPWHLAPWDAIRAITKVMAFGANKYAPRNWEKGFDYHRLYRATIEHMNSWWMGEDKDPETGYSHLSHAGCCILFLIAHEIRGIGRDTRPGKEKMEGEK